MIFIVEKWADEYLLYPDFFDDFLSCHYLCQYVVIFQALRAIDVKSIMICIYQLAFSIGCGIMFHGSYTKLMHRHRVISHAISKQHGTFF